MIGEIAGGGLLGSIQRTSGNIDVLFLDKKVMPACDGGSRTRRQPNYIGTAELVKFTTENQDLSKADSQGKGAAVAGNRDNFISERLDNAVRSSEID